MEQSPFQQQQNMGSWYPHQYQAPSIPQPHHQQQHEQHDHHYQHQYPPQQNEHQYQQQHQHQQHQHQQYQHQQQHAMAWSPAPLAPPGDQSFSYSQAPPYQQPQAGYYPHPQQQQVHHQYPSVPPQFTYTYGQQDQAWQAGNNNSVWNQQHWSYPAPNIDLSQEEVWAAKARAWAASKVVQDEPSSAPAAIQPYPEYGQHKQQDEHHMEEKKHQESGEHNPPPRQGFEKPLVMLEPNIDGSDRKSALGPPGTDGLDSVHQLPSQQGSAQMHIQSASHLLHQSQASPLSSQPRFSYTDKPMPHVYEHQQQPPSNYHQQPPQPPLPQYQLPVVVEPHEGEFGLSPASLQNWAPVGGPGMPFPPAMGPVTAQFDPLHPPQMGMPLYGRPDAQGLGFPPFVGGVGPSLGPGPGAPLRPVFLPDSAYPERPKKAAVPSWLREEIMKKKAAGLTGNVPGTGTGMLLSDEHSRGNDGESIIPSNQRLGISDKVRGRSPGLSEDEEEDQEEEIEAARTAAINQEIKRLLTEVLLKVTGDLFDEIAQEILDEDDNDIVQDRDSVDHGRTTGHISAAPDSGVSSLSGRVLVPSVKGHVANDSDENRESSESGAPGGDVLGLGNYASDDEEIQNSEDTKSDKYLHSSRETETEKEQEHGNLDGDSNQGILKGDAQSEIADPIFQRSIQVPDVKHDMELDSKKNEVEKRTENEVGNSKKKRARDQEDAALLEQSSGGDDQNGRRILLSEDHNAHNETNTQEASFSSKNRSSERASTIEQEQEQDRNEIKSNVRLALGQDLGSSGISKEPGSLRKLENASDDLSVKDKKKDEKRNEGKKEKDSSSVKKKDLMVKEKDLSVKEKKREDFRESKAERIEERLRDPSRDKRKERGKEKTKSRDKDYDRDKRKHEKKEQEEKKERDAKKERNGRPRNVEGSDKKVHHRSSSSGSASSSSSSDKSRGRMRTSSSRREHHSNLPSPLGRSRIKRVSRSRSRSPHAKHIHRRNAPHEKSRRDASRSPVHRRRRG